MKGQGSSSQGPVFTKISEWSRLLFLDPGPRPLIFFTLLLLLSGCGYTVGASGSPVGVGSTPQQDGGPARTIAVPLLNNTTPEPLLGQIVSERMKAELLAAGAWRIVNTGQKPELVLNGRVNTLKSTPVAFDADRRATEYQLEIHIDLTLTRATDGSMIWSAPDLVGLADYYVDRNSVALSRESKERAFHDAGQRLAESVVQQLSLLPKEPAASSEGGGGKSAGTTDAAPTTPPPVAPSPTTPPVK